MNSPRPVNSTVRPGVKEPGGMRMGVLNSQMKRLIERQRLSFVATVCPDGTPNRLRASLNCKGAV